VTSGATELWGIVLRNFGWVTWAYESKRKAFAWKKLCARYRTVHGPMPESEARKLATALNAAEKALK
jgi:hypothetical protein